MSPLDAIPTSIKLAAVAVFLALLAYSQYLKWKSSRAAEWTGEVARNSTRVDPSLTMEDEFELFMGVDSLLEWLPRNSDPELWHMLVGRLNYDYDETLEIVDWIVSQPKCDRATAALALEMISPDSIIDKASEAECEIWERWPWRIAHTISQQSANGLYKRSSFNLASEGWDNDVTPLRDMLLNYERELAQQGRKVHWRVPVELLSETYNGRDARSSKFHVHEDGLYVAKENGEAA